MAMCRRVLCVIGAICALFGLPAETSCDSSYYEKFYAARRFVPPKINALLLYNFTVTIKPELVSALSGEHVALTGNVKELGEWRAQDAVLLNRTELHNVWHGVVMLPPNAQIEYKYFVAATEYRAQDGAAKAPQHVLIRHWEAHAQPRSFNTTKLTGNRTDSFGLIKSVQQLRRGWLNSGQIVQLKVFQSAVFYDSTPVEDEIYVQLQAVDPETRVPIVNSARAQVEYVRMEYGNSVLRLQSQFGVPYKSNDTLLFHATLAQLHNVAFLIRLYGKPHGSELIRQMCFQYIQPGALTGSTGTLKIELLSPVLLTVIGQLRLEYLIVQPLTNSSFDFRTSYINHWPAHWHGLDIGHRGLGKSLAQTKHSAPITENTLAALKATGILGADMVEFDVHLTSDHVPVIYHDYYIRVCMDSKTPTSPKDLTQVLIKDVTYEQLKNLKTYQVLGTTKIIEYPAHNNVEDFELRLFPTLEDLFRRVNRTLAFDIELKWPQLKANGSYESKQTIDKNIFVDCVLNVVQRYGCGRLNVLKSFDADICTLLRYKQNMYPVLFLTASTERVYADPRTHNVLNSVNFAQAFDLAGIVPNAALIKHNPKLVQLSKAVLPLVFVWGAELKDRETIDWFKELKVNGVIYDRMDLLLPMDDVNVLRSDADFPAFYAQGCNATTQDVGSGSGANTTLENILSNVNFL